MMILLPIWLRQVDCSPRLEILLPRSEVEVVSETVPDILVAINMVREFGGSVVKQL